MSTLAEAPPRYSLRPYQQEAEDAFFDEVNTGVTETVIALATGAGKSPLMGSIVARARRAHPPTRVTVVAHRAELVKQNANAMRMFNDARDVGIYSAGLNERIGSRPITIANIQSIVKQSYKFAPSDIVIIDEAHRVTTSANGQLRQFIEAQRLQNPAVVVLGLTATPYKLTSGLIYGQPDSLFKTLCHEADIVRLIEEKWLCKPITPRTSVNVSAAGVKLSGGEYIAKMLAEVVDVETVTEAACDEIVSLAAERHHIIVFTVSVAHAEHVAEALTRRGMPAAAVHGKQSQSERDLLVSSFRQGGLRALVNCELYVEGFDVPEIDCVSLLRPTKSVGLMMQMIGRGMRIHPSKQDCLILDQSKLIEQHGTIDNLRIPSKGKKGEPGEMIVKVCPACENYQPSGVRVCRDCGHQFPDPVPDIQSEASTKAILSADIEPEWHTVQNVTYVRNEKKKDKLHDTFRSIYECGFRNSYSDFVCIEHPLREPDGRRGFARKKAEEWWAKRSPEDCPDTIERALDLADDLRKPLRIATRPQKNAPQYSEICAYEFPDDPARHKQLGLPRVCWSCALFDDVTKYCNKWDGYPPVETQQVGCEAWADAQEEEKLPF